MGRLASAGFQVTRLAVGPDRPVMVFSEVGIAREHIRDVLTIMHESELIASIECP